MILFFSRLILVAQIWPLNVFIDNMNLHDFRRQYQQGGLRRHDLHIDPILQFEHWFNELLACDVPDPTAMVLATVDQNQQANQRIVLLKKADHEGFTFFTNYKSTKARDIERNNLVSLHFPWHFLERQVIVSGMVEKVNAEESEAYFHSRSQESQWAAWASSQSEAIDTRQQLIDRYAVIQSQYPTDIPLPDFWGGYRVVPKTLEFWQGGEHRLHDRFIYSRETEHSDNEWSIQRLAP